MTTESEVREELQQVFSRYINRIVVTCFSSNIARIINIVHAAKKNNVIPNRGRLAQLVRALR